MSLVLDFLCEPFCFYLYLHSYAQVYFTRTKVQAHLDTYIFLCQPLREDLMTIYSYPKVEDHLKVSWN